MAALAQALEGARKIVEQVLPHFRLVGSSAGGAVKQQTITHISALDGGFSGSAVIKAILDGESGSTEVVVKAVKGFSWMMNPTPQPYNSEGPDMYDASIDLFQRMREGLRPGDPDIAEFFPLSSPEEGKNAEAETVFGGGVGGDGRGHSVQRASSCKYVLKRDATNCHAVCRFKSGVVTLKKAIEDRLISVEDSRQKLAISMGVMHRESLRVAKTPEANVLLSRAFEMNYSYMFDKYIFQIRHKVPLDKSVGAGKTVGECLGHLDSILRHRMQRIYALPRILIHNDFQAKNLIFEPTTKNLTVIDIDTSVVACRVWDFLFLLIGSDEGFFFTPGHPPLSTDGIITKFADSLEVYMKASGAPLSEEEIFLLPNILQIRVAHVLSHYSNNIADNDLHFCKMLEAWFHVFEHMEVIRSSARKANESIL